MRIERLRNRRDIRHGFGSEESRARLVLYGRILEETARLHLRWLPGAAPLEVKVLLAIHASEDAAFALRVEERLAELGGADHEDEPAGLAALIAHLRSLDTWGKYVGAVYSVIKPALVDRWEDHFTGANLLLDEPTARLLGDLMRVAPQHISGGMVAVEAVNQMGDGASLSAAVAELRTQWSALDTEESPGSAEEQTPPAPDYQVPARDEFLRIEDKTLMGSIPELLLKAAPMPDVDFHAAVAPELHAWMNEELIRAELFSRAGAHPSLSPARRERIARLAWDRVRHVQALEKLLELCGGSWGAYPATLDTWRSAKRASLREIAGDRLAVDALAGAYAAAGRTEFAHAFDAMHIDNEWMRRLCREIAT